MVLEKAYTIVFVRDGDNILLGFKKRGFLQHYYNGFGGKLESGETPVDAAIRELEEECGLISSSNRLIDNGILRIDLPELQAHIYLYTTYEFTGIITETEEMKPEWFNIHDIPYCKMRQDTSIWLPLIIKGKKIKAYFRYNDDDNIVNQYVDVL